MDEPDRLRRIELDPKNLPDPVAMGVPEVRIPREKVVRFRNSHAILVAFAADVLGIDETKVCTADLLEHLGYHPITTEAVAEDAKPARAMRRVLNSQYGG